MAHGKGSLGAERIVALATAREPSRSKTELYSCLALLFGAVATLTAVITYLAIAPGAAVAPSNDRSALDARRSVRDERPPLFSARLFVHRLPRCRCGAFGSTARASHRGTGAPA
jgi:hypothetical protein